MMRLLGAWLCGSVSLGVLWLAFGGRDDSTCWHASLRTDGEETW